MQASASFTFDYLSLLLIASTIAGIGLATNNTVAIVASMLVSPIMGPVMALTFGTVVNNYSLTLLGLKSELLSLLICVVVGFVIGVVSIFIGTDGLWPTDEMKGRGLVDGLAVGFAIAIPSGVGIALSILGNNTSSLVGVAISASLLPPAVNCGLALAYGALGFIYDADAVDDDNADYTTPSSFVNMGGVSLALTVINIGAIYVSGLVMFRIKEVVPIKNKTAFWQRDIKVSRRINTAIHRQQDYRFGQGNSRGISHLQQDLESSRLDPDMRHQLLQLRRRHSVQEVLSTSTVRSPHAGELPTQRPRLADIFSKLATQEDNEVDEDDDDDGDSAIYVSSSPRRKRPMSMRHPSPSSRSSGGGYHRARSSDSPSTQDDSAIKGGSGPATFHRDHSYLDAAKIREIKKRFREQGRPVNTLRRQTSLPAPKFDDLSSKEE